MKVDLAPQAVPGPSAGGCAGCTRREVLRGGAAAAALPALAALGGCAPRIDVPTAIPVAAPVAGKLSVLLSLVPQLRPQGGSALLHPAAVDDLGRPLSLLVVNSASQGLLAFDAYCPHARCELAYDGAADELICPCHLSRFDAGGRVLNPPARGDLTVYPIEQVSETYSIDLSDTAFPPAVDGLITFTTDDLPALQKVGGSVTGHAGGVPFPIVAVRTAAAAAKESIAAFNAHCTHLGCAVSGTGSAGLLICRCHGSLFSTADGAAKLGPAILSIARVTVVSFDGLTVVLSTKAPA